MALARAGETDKLKLANFALGELRQTSQRRLSEMRVLREADGWRGADSLNSQAS